LRKKVYCKACYDGGAQELDGKFYRSGATFALRKSFSKEWKTKFAIKENFAGA